MQVEAFGEHSLQDIELGKKMIDALAHYYPNHAFFVDCNHSAGTMSIQLLYEDQHHTLRKWKFGMLIHLINLHSDPEIKRYAMKFGGELLERFRLARGAADLYSRVDAWTNGLDMAGAH